MPWKAKYTVVCVCLSVCVNCYGCSGINQVTLYASSHVSWIIRSSVVMVSCLSYTLNVVNWYAMMSVHGKC